VTILEQYPERIFWDGIASNPKAVHLFYPLDYEKTKEANQSFREELVARVFDPERLIRQANGMPLREYLSHL
jgi:hypothetical protein